MMRISRNGKAAFSLLSDCKSDNVSGIQTKQQDAELLRVCARFHSLDAKLDRLVARDDPPERELIALHDRWSDLLAEALTLPAYTIEGQQAKDAVLKTALGVMLGTLPAQSDKPQLTVA